MSKDGAPRPDNHVIVLFGATGDLAKRKLLPGLYHLRRSPLSWACWGRPAWPGTPG
jgi:hypothetical protein